jgi:membrane protein DedA with SNARE-associated domain
VAGEYAALLAFAVLGGVGVPGPGDAGLIAAALLAAEGHLSLAVVLIVAYIGCLVGRAIGYQIGAEGGRALMERPGWFSGIRSATLAKGDRVFGRFPRSAVLIAPATIFGIYRVPPPIFALASLLVGLSWVLSTGLIAYFLGEAALEVIGRAGFRGFLVIVVLVGLGLVLRYLWHHRRPPAEVSAPSER